MLDDAAINSLLSGITAPQLGADLIKTRVADAYGLSGDWSPLGGEREQNLALRATDGNEFVVKVASPQERLETLQFQAEALAHIHQVDPALPVPKVVPTRAGASLCKIVDPQGTEYPLRILTYVPGSTLIEQLRARSTALSMEQLITLGEFHGRLARSLQGFHHRAARQPLAWDLSNGLVEGAWLREHIPESLSGLVRPIVDRFASDVLPGLSRLRSQVIYNDFHEANVLVRFAPGLEVSGVIDFGDMCYGPVAQDLAVAVASLIHWSADPVAAAAALARGYQRNMPLESADLAVLLDLTLARLILHIGLVRYQMQAFGRKDDSLEELDALYIRAVQALAPLEPSRFVAGVAPTVAPSLVYHVETHDSKADAPLLARRRQVLGAAYLFYDEPLELVRGRGARLYDAAGREYIDCYNNVANVGHAQPYVVDALARQAATLNTNTRYLHTEILRLGERLSATLPDGLDTWFFVCTGSEANDLAVRIAQLATGRSGVTVMEHSYHGNTSVLAPLSLLDYDIKDKPDWVEAAPPPNVYRGLYRAGTPNLGARYAAHISEGAERLGARGRPMAALLLDSIFDANGALVPPQDYMRLAFDNARRAGALTIADEVQMGFARSGSHMWGFQAYGVCPDIVTMGKPMGNGHPIAAVVTRREIALEFQRKNGYFNTFGGNTVSAVVANATLDVLQGDALQENAQRVGARFESLLGDLMQRHELVGHIHGRGLFYGVELVEDRDTRRPAKLAARWVRERMKSLGILIASSGPLGNIIKIRPPLCIDISDAETCVAALDRALAEVPSDRRRSIPADVN